MSDRAGSEVEVESEGGSDEEQFKEAANRVEEGAAEQKATRIRLPIEHVSSILDAALA